MHSTGEVAPGMLKDVGCEYVIIGHSRARRQYFGETNENVNRKAKASHAHGLIYRLSAPGETLAEREAGKTEVVVKEQLLNGIAGLSAAQIIRTVIAYEPVWAIGTGHNASPDPGPSGALRLSGCSCRKTYSDDVAYQVRIQYGGSVKPDDNAATLIAQSDVDGALVGTASWDAEIICSNHQSCRQRFLNQLKINNYYESEERSWKL